MGGLESRFNSLLVEDKATEAKEMWSANPDLQSSYRPNSQIKFSPNRDTPLHCTARLEMEDMLAAFLMKGGDPLIRNNVGDTPLHIVCTSAKFSSRRSKRKANLLQILLDKISEDRSKKTSELGVQNKARNTPLHLAAASGLLDCVEILLAHDAPLFVCNVAGQTPCDIAWEGKQLIIAKQLESKMVFTSDPNGDESPSPRQSRTKTNSFHDSRALLNLKKDIVDSLSKRLEIPEFPAQALLMAHGWSEELVIEAWANDRDGACEKAGIDVAMVTASGEVGATGDACLSLSIHRCGICDEEIHPLERIRSQCGHHFCQHCWKVYLETQINTGAGHEIRCPGYQCFKLVSDEVISSLVSKDQLEKYSELNLKQFVDSSSGIRWCPFPDCSYAICIKDTKSSDPKADTPSDVNGACAAVVEDWTPGINVECGRGHGFCWHCMKEPHEPSSCELWENWKDIISRMTSDEDAKRITSQAQEDAKWIMRNTKPCPNCKAPIQKSEGCNHMTCKGCRHDFCWVCLDPWSLHNHRTGGYFTCNRFSAQARAEEEVSKARSVMEEEYVKQAKDDLEVHTKRFYHYHDRYNNHLHSLDLEMKLLQGSSRKLRELEILGQALDKKVARVKGRMDTGNFTSSEPSPEKISVFTADKSTNFLDEIFRVLLRARRILSASYCIGYFIPESEGDVLGAHETLQGKLEEAVEVLSEMVSRQYLQTPQSKMNEAARNVDYLCDEYLTEMSAVATIAALAVKKRSQSTHMNGAVGDQQHGETPPGDDIPDDFQPTLYRLIGLFNRDGFLHFLRVPEEDLPELLDTV